MRPLRSPANVYNDNADDWGILRFAIGNNLIIACVLRNAIVNEPKINAGIFISGLIRYRNNDRNNDYDTRETDDRKLVNKSLEFLGD